MNEKVKKKLTSLAIAENQKYFLHNYKKKKCSSMNKF